MIKNLEIFNFLSQVLYIILAGGALYIITKLINRLINYFTSKKSNRKIIYRATIYLEIFIWFAFIVWSIDLLITTTMLNNAVVLSMAAVLFLFLMWFIGKDALAGLIFRLENTIEIGNKIKSSADSGTIKKMGVRVLTVESENGQLFYLPYSKLFSEKITVFTDDTKYHPFELKLSVNKDRSPQEFKMQINELIINSPYSSPLFLPAVSFSGEANNKYNFNIIFYALNSEHFNRILSHINHKLAS